MELSSALEPGRPPKSDKATILCDAVRMLSQLRAEAQELKESNHQLREAIKDLKVRLFVQMRFYRSTLSIAMFVFFSVLCSDV